MKRCEIGGVRVTWKPAVKQGTEPVIGRAYKTPESQQCAQWSVVSGAKELARGMKEEVGPITSIKPTTHIAVDIIC